MYQRKHSIFIILLSLFAYGEEDLCKHSLKCNMIHLYEETAAEVTNLSEIFTEGIYYARLRFNSFGFLWEKELENVRKNHLIAGMGGSFHYKSASFYGMSIGTGVYGTMARGSLSQENVSLYKAGKDTFSRYDVLREGSQGYAVLAEGYLSYEYEEHSLKVGRQIFESFLTKSNDTKMIPNTFSGVSVETKLMQNNWLKAAYFTQQKLRDHSEFHRVLAFGDNPNNLYDSYRQNDDSAMHKGITSAKLDAQGIEDNLLVLEMLHHAMDDLTFRLNYTAVPKLISSAMIQADYRWGIGDWHMIPGIRYMRQFDNGAGELAGANLKTLTAGYMNPQRLDAQLYAARIDVVNEVFKLRFGYSSVSNQGDIVAPWRGFPTGGFTRAMGQYNWNANTTSYMMQLDYDFQSVENLKLVSRFVVQDFDDTKPGVQADSHVFSLDLAKNLFENKLYLKTRYAKVMGDEQFISGTDVMKRNPSYDELRIEINYLF